MFRKLFIKLTLAASLIVAATFFQTVAPPEFKPIAVAEAQCVVPYQFKDYKPGQPPQPITAGQLNANFSALAGCNQNLTQGAVFCNGVGDGTTDDTLAIDACVAAAGPNGAVVLTKNYRITQNRSYAPEFFFLGGDLKPDNGITLTIVGPVIAADTDQVFLNATAGFGTVLVPNTGRVSVAWWGAYAAVAAATDPFPAIRASLGSNRIIFFPSAAYECGSYDTNIFPLVQGNNCLQINGYSHFVLDGYGAILGSDANHHNVNLVSINNSFDFTVRGFDIQNNTTGMSPGSEPTGFIMVTDGRFNFEDITFVGNWGGSTRSPSAFAADWIFQANFSRINLPQQSECFDLAYVASITIDHLNALGADDNGTTNNPTQLPCISIQTDLAMLAAYPAQANAVETDTVSITNSFFANFNQGVFLSSGHRYTISGNTFRSNGGSGVDIYWQPGGLNVSSAGFPVQQVTITGNLFTSNGSVGIDFNSSQINNSDVLGYATVSGNYFDSNDEAFGNIAIGADSPSHLALVAIGQNQYSNQSLPVNDNMILVAGTYRLPTAVLTIANGSSAQLPNGAGHLVLHQENGCVTSGDVGSFDVGGTGVAFIASSQGTWVNSTTPSSGHIGVAYATTKNVYNNLGCTVTVNGYLDVEGSTN